MHTICSRLPWYVILWRWCYTWMGSSRSDLTSPGSLTESSIVKKANTNTYVEYRLGHFCCNALTFIKSKNDKYYSLGLKNLTSPHSFKRCRQWHRRVGLGGVIDTIESTPQSYWFKLRSFIHTRLCGVSSDILKKICNFLNTVGAVSIARA